MNLFLSTFLLFLGFTAADIISGDFTATNSLRADGFAVWEPKSESWQRFYEGAFAGGNSVFGSLSQYSFGSFSSGNNADRIAFKSADTFGVSFFDGTQFIHHLGQLDGSNGGPRVDSGIFEFLQFKNQNKRSAGTISNVVVSGNVVFVCGVFNKIGTDPSLIANVTQACSNNNCDSNAVNAQHIAAYVLGNSYNDNTKPGWKYVWPQGYDSNGNPTGIGPTTAYTTTQIFRCDSMTPVGTDGRILIEEVDGSNRNFWTFQVAGSTTASKFSSAHTLASTYGNSIQALGDTIYVWGRNFDGSNTETINYILSKAITTSGVLGWASVVAPNSTWTGQFNQWIVGGDLKFYHTMQTCRNTATSNCYKNDNFRTRYVYQYTGAPGKTEVAYSATVLGNKQLTLTSSPSACQPYSFQSPPNDSALTPTLFWDFRLNKLIVYNKNLNWVMTGDCENELMYKQPYDHQQSAYNYYSKRLNGIAQWDGSTFSPVYGGSLGAEGSTIFDIKGIAQDRTSGRVYFWGSFDWAYNTYTTYVAQYNTQTLNWQFPVSPVSFDGYPATNSEASVRFAQWINDQDLVVAGSFRSINGVKMNSIAILHKQGSPDSLPKTGNCQWPGKTAACNRVGVRSTAGSTGNFLANFRTPGTVRDVIVNNGYIYVLGDFDFCGDIPCSKLARFNIQGQKWEDLQTGWVGGQTAYTFLFYGGNLWVAGNFDQVNNVLASNIAYVTEGPTSTFKWNSPNTGIPGSGVSNIVRLIPYDGYLLALGNFQSASGEYSPFASRWVGNRWTYISTRNLTTPCSLQELHLQESCSPSAAIVDGYLLNGRIYLLLSNNQLWSWRDDEGFKRISVWSYPGVNGDIGRHFLGKSSNSNTNDNLYVWYASSITSNGVETNNLVEFNPDLSNFVQTPNQAGTNYRVWFTKRNW